jgi:hypothetical protein
LALSAILDAAALIRLVQEEKFTESVWFTIDSADVDMVEDRAASSSFLLLSEGKDSFICSDDSFSTSPEEDEDDDDDEEEEQDSTD